MKMNVTFKEQDETLKANFGEVTVVGGEGLDLYDKGYSEGYTAGHGAGYKKGETEGYNSGFTEGKTEGVTEGRNAESSDFWDNYQQNGNRTDYDYGFSGEGWTDETFKPKYDITPVSVVRMFTKTRIINLKELLINLGIALDFSNATSVNYPLQDSSITEVGILNFSSVSNLSYFLNSAKNLKYIEKLILSNSGNQTFNATTSFGGCIALEHMIVEGVIGQNNFNVQWSPLDVESLVSIMNALADKSTDTSGTAWKVKIGATNKAKLTEEQLQIASNKKWTVE